MKFWIDAQLPPQLALWLTDTFSVKAFSFILALELLKEGENVVEIVE